jgi:hypothetical protein
VPTPERDRSKEWIERNHGVKRYSDKSYPDTPKSSDVAR